MNGDVLYKSTGNSLTMAAGSDPQPVESSVVPHHNLVPPNSLTRITGVRNHIPYSDHNYGKPLTPPDSCSPEHPEEADTGNEEEGFTRCICGYKHDDGYMICCDKCSAWQHIECVGIKGNSVPDTYLCDLCYPRPLDKERAKQIQAKKREEPTEDFTCQGKSSWKDEDDEEDGDVSDHDSDNNGLPPQVPLPMPSSIKENILAKGKRKKRETTRKLGQKDIKHNKKKRRKRKHITADALPVDEDTNGPWNLNTLPNVERYEEAHKTVYIGDLLKKHFPVSEPQVTFPHLMKHEQLCKVVEVQKNKKGVVVTEDTNSDQFIVECIGNLMLESQFKEEHPLFPKCYPFVLYYTKLDHLQLVMNFSTYGNDARYIRRSCSPTAQVRHVMVDNQLRLIIVSTTALAKGSEVTVAFEFPFQEYRLQLDCACARDDCAVQKHNLAIQSVEQTNGFRGGKDEHNLLDSSLSNQMDSDSEGDNSNDAKDKRNRKKLSREDRKLQAYLRQIEKMEKTEKKRQQTSGRDGARTGILTQRNLADDYNCDNTPSKPAKVMRKQSMNQRRKVHTIMRRGSRHPSCSSEPHSPEDHYSSAASTPTTPLVNVVEEHNEVQQHHDTPEKSFKFPKFKKGSLNDMSSSNGDQRRSNNVSPDTEYLSTPCKPSLLEARMVEVQISDHSFHNCERLPNLDQTCNGSTSPRTDPNASPSPCHSTYASPTHSENVDLHDQSSRHGSASPPTSNSVASYLLSQRHHTPSSLHTTLKKRWLLKYMNEQSVDKRPNGLLSPPMRPLNRVIMRPRPPLLSSRTFPLPYKRRKLMEYQSFVSNQSLARTSIVSVCQPTSAVTLLTTIASTMASASTVCSTSASVTSRSVTSAITSVTSRSMTSATSSMTSLGMTSLGVTSSSVMSLSDVREDSARQRTVSGSDGMSSARSSLSSVSSTEDVKMDTEFTEPHVNRVAAVDTSTGRPKTEALLKPISSSAEGPLRMSITSGTHSQLKGISTSIMGSSKCNADDIPLRSVAGSEVSPQSAQPVDRLSSSVLPECSVEPSTSTTTNCSTLQQQQQQGDSATSRDNMGQVGSSADGTGNSTTAGGKKKVSLSEYLNRKRTSISKKDSTPGLSSEVCSPSRPRVPPVTSVVTTACNSDSPVSSVSSYSSNYGGSSLSSCVTSSTGGVLIEPVSPDDSYNNRDDDRPLLHSATQDLRPAHVVREAKPSIVCEPYYNSSLMRPTRPVSEPGSSSDAMDIEEDEAPSSNTILVNTPVMKGTGTAVAPRAQLLSSFGKSYQQLDPGKLNSIPPRQPAIVAQNNEPLVSPDALRRRPGLVSSPRLQNPAMQPRHQDFHAASGRPPPPYH